MKRKGRKWADTNPRRHFNNTMIFDLLKRNWTEGLKLNEIIKKSGLSKPTAIRRLQELLSEHKIFKLVNTYFPDFDDDFIFGFFLSDYINFFLTKMMEKKQTISDPSRDLFKDPLDNSIFAFSNAIGGLITYVLIECSNVYADEREPAKIKELINIIFKGLIWQNIFYQFAKLFRDSLDNMQTINDKKGFDKLSESLTKVYPTLYKSLETNKIKFFNEWVKNDPRDSSLHENCRHEWKERYLFKCGRFDECVKCRSRRLK